MIDKHHIEITYNDYITKYSFLNSLFSPIENFDGLFFGPNSFELEYVQNYNSAHVWSKVITDDGEIRIISGYNHYEGMAFFITQEPVPYNTRIEVKLD